MGPIIGEENDTTHHWLDLIAELKCIDKKKSGLVSQNC